MAWKKIKPNHREQFPIYTSLYEDEIVRTGHSYGHLSQPFAKTYHRKGR